MRFERQAVTVPAGGALVEDWRDALVLVVRGEIDVEARGGRERFARGAVLSLSGLPLRALRNQGAEPAELLAVRRRRAARVEPAGR
jgi:glyoxylate utilization-related uncharacterized protein